MMSNFNLVWWLWWRLCVHRHGMTTYVRAPSRVLSYFHYINSDLRCHFLIFCYGIFMSLRRSKSYQRNMSAYNLCIFFPFSLVSTMWRHFFVPLSFVSTLYPVLYTSFSNLDSIISPHVSMLESISSWFDPNFTTFPTHSTSTSAGVSHDPFNFCLARFSMILNRNCAWVLSSVLITTLIWLVWY